MTFPAHPLVAPAMTRREALQRAAAFLGVAISPSLFRGVMHAQAAEASPRHLSAAQLALAAALAERIIPRTDTPGALDVGVPAFIDLMYGEYLAPLEAEALEAALAHFESAASRAHDRGFGELTAEEQDALLLAAAESPTDRDHFLRMRELTVVGYFTSQPVGRDVLNFNPIPGPYHGCIPLSEVGNVSWTPPR